MNNYDKTYNLPPQSKEAEVCLLGCLLIDWSKMIDVITKVKSTDFYLERHRVIYEGMVKLYKDNINCDYITLTDELTAQKKLEKAGNLAYVTSLTSVVPTAANYEYYVNIVVDNSIRRNLIKAAKSIETSGYDYSRKIKTILEVSEQSIFTLADENTESQIYEIKPVIDEVVDNIKQSIDSSQNLTGIPSGIAKLDYITSGFQNAEMIIIGARPSIGKTAFALSMIQHIAIEKKIPCGLFSLEMSRQSIGQRLLSQMTHISCNKIRTSVTKEEYKLIEEKLAQYNEAPLYIVDTPNIQLLELRSLARRLKLNNNIKILFIDYIGLIGTEDNKRPVYEIISEISKSLKALARELKIPIVALCQVARDAEGREPTLAQLRGSGSIEQDADVIMFLHRDRSNIDSENEGLEAKCIIAKQRNGATGTIDMLFFPKWTKFENMAYEN